MEALPTSSSNVRFEAYLYQNHALIHGIKTALATALGLCLAWLLKPWIEHPEWIVISAVVVMTMLPNVGGVIQRAIYRLVATILATIVALIVIFTTGNDWLAVDITLVLGVMIFTIIAQNPKYRQVGMLSAVTLVCGGAAMPERVAARAEIEVCELCALGQPAEKWIRTRGEADSYADVHIRPTTEAEHVHLVLYGPRTLWNPIWGKEIERIDLLHFHADDELQDLMWQKGFEIDPAKKRDRLCYGHSPHCPEFMTFAKCHTDAGRNCPRSCGHCDPLKDEM